MNKQEDFSAIVPEKAASDAATSRMFFCRLILEIPFEQLL
jgi:hypothetical protein